MIELTDAKIAEVLQDRLNFPIDRCVFGNYFVAKNYWIRYNTDKPGVEMLPWCAFFRTFRFSEVSKKAGELEIIDVDGTAKTVKFMPVMLAYIVELVTSTVHEANLLSRRWMMFCGECLTIDFEDTLGINWKFRIIPEDIEDSSDLEQEEDLGRLIRTVLNFQVESVIIDRGSQIALPVLDILTQMHLYYGNTLESNLIDTWHNLP